MASDTVACPLSDERLRELLAGLLVPHARNCWEMTDRECGLCNCGAEGQNYKLLDRMRRVAHEAAAAEAEISAQTLADTDPIYVVREDCTEEECCLHQMRSVHALRERARAHRAAAKGS